MTTDPATRIAELTATIEAQLAVDETTAQAAITASGQWYKGDRGSGEWAVDGTSISDSTGGYIVFDEGCPTVEQFDHIARNDPASVLRRVTATRELTAAILALPHQWWTCALAVPPDTPEDRCTCGRDGHVARLLGIIASEWEGHE